MADADIAIVHEMGKRISENKKDLAAYGGKGQAYFRMGEYKAADEAFAAGVEEVEEYLKALKRWKRKCETHLEGGEAVVVAAAAAATAPSQTVQDVRVDWFQTPENVTVDLFIHSSQQLAKGSTDHAKVKIEEDNATAEVTLKNGKTFTWEASPLFAAIDVATSTFTVRHMKVEIVLVKKVGGIPWDTLTGTRGVAPKEPGAYPTSNLKRRDWTKETIEVEDDKPEGSDALNCLFQDIYSRGDEATRKAMNKSFQESSGTVLSTNWGEVGVKKVEGQPPAGMESRQWGK